MGTEKDRPAERVGRRWLAALWLILVVLALGLGGLGVWFFCGDRESGRSEHALIPGDPPVGRGGWHDTYPSISDDGKTVVWFHIAETDARICQATAPFESAPATLKVDERLGSLSPAVSGDGRLVFWSGRGEDDAFQLQQASIKNGKLVEPVPVAGVKADWLGLCVSRDGTRVAFLDDGKPGQGVSPIWRSVRTALLKEGSPVLSEYLTPRDRGKYVDRLFMSSAGDALAFMSFAEGGIMEARLRDAVSWDTKPVDVPGLGKVGLEGLSPDGDILLLQGASTQKSSKPAAFWSSVYVMRKVGGAWQKPEKAAEMPDIYRMAMTADGKRIVMACYDRWPDVNTITRTSLQVVRFEDGAWSQPGVLVEEKGSPQIIDLVLSPTGCLAWSWWMQRLDRTGLFYRKDLEPGTESVDLSAKLEAAIKKEAAGDPAKPDAKP